MSGHSKWAKIKRQKGIKDVRRGAIFTKLAKNITLSAKEGGADPGMNFSLRLAIDKAKVANMPIDNIDRAIKKAVGEGDKAEIKRITYEAFCIGSVAMLIDCQTDNTNRSIAEVRLVLETAGAKIANSGSVSWKFQEKGLISILLAKKVKSEKYGEDYNLVNCSKDDLELELMDMDGIVDIDEGEEYDESKKEEIKVLYIYTDKVNFANVINKLEQNSYVIFSAELIKQSDEQITLSNEDDKQKIISLIENLEDLEDVESVWTDVNL